MVGLATVGDSVAAEHSALLEHMEVDSEQSALDYTVVSVQNLVVLRTIVAA